MKAAALAPALLALLVLPLGMLLPTAGAARVTASTIPATPERGVYQRGYAVYYPGCFDGGSRMTAAHRTLPLGSWISVRSSKTGRSIVVRINDRGPFGSRERILDLSATAARALGILSQGVAPVTISVLSRP